VGTTRNFFSYTITKSEQTLNPTGGAVITSLAGVTWDVHYLDAAGAASSATVYDARSSENNSFSGGTTDYNGVISFWAEPGEYKISISDSQSRIGAQDIYWSSVSGQEGGIPGTKISTDNKLDSNQIAADAIKTVEIEDQAVTSAKIQNGTIVNADVNASAAISYSKLNLGTSIVNADISPSASISYSKLNLAGSIATADFVASGVTTNQLGASAVTTAKIADGSITTAKFAAAPSGVSTTNINDSAVTAAKIANENWTSWASPTFAAGTVGGTAPTLGNSTIVGRYQRISNTVHAKFKLTVGSSFNEGNTGTYVMTLPIAGNSGSVTAGEIVGRWYYKVSSSSDIYTGYCSLTPTGNFCNFIVDGIDVGSNWYSNGGYIGKTLGHVSGSAPTWNTAFPEWATGDILSASLTYEIYS
jgi:hypothetical protein